MESSQQGASPFTVEFAASVADDLLALRFIDRNRVLRKIDEQLLREPTKPTRNKKVVQGLVPPWEHEPPVWELRVGEIRVFYDVSELEAALSCELFGTSRRIRRPRKYFEDITR